MNPQSEIKLHPGLWHGNITIPPSKSHFQRLLLGALLAEGRSFIHCTSYNQDTETVLQLIQNLGAETDRQEDGIWIQGGLKFQDASLFAGESGLAARMFLPILALNHERMLFYATGSLSNRSQAGIVDSLSEMGVELQATGTGFPLYVKGPIQPGRYTINASLSSQFLTGLLFTLPLLKDDSQLNVINLNSKPYIDLTLNTLQSFGVKISHQEYQTFSIPGNQSYQAGTFIPEGDWSNAAFFIVAGLLAGSAKLQNLNPESSQGDKSILHYIPKSNYSWENENLIIRKASHIPAFQADLAQTPDLFPPLTALAAVAEGTSILHGTNRLLNKESNRRDSLIREFSALGVKLWEDDNCLYIEGGTISGGVVHAHNDHRIAMALAIASLRADNEVIIQDAAAVAKSYPGFWDDFSGMDSSRL
ncbi:MAG: 3-phosphoshikimate 1-carboxyvinyltransferase [Bacteroidales bacterium]|nr:3-phosphoshikimate 1-carboxyvinyltransferase [Bacteroidales bacterium]